MATNFPAGSANDAILQLQNKALFSTHLKRPSTMALMQGKMPTQADAEAAIKGKLAAEMPIVVNEDLTRVRGSRIQTKFAQPITAKPIMGSEIAEGKGAAQEIETGEFKIDQARFVMSAGDKMSQQRTEIDLYTLAKSNGLQLANKYADESMLVHLAGARGSQSSGAWTIPLESDSDFSKIVINALKAPTRNRHFTATSSGIEKFYDGTVNEPTSTSVLSIEALDALSATLSEMDYQPLPIRFQDDDQAYDSNLNILMVSPTAYNSFKQANSRVFQQWQSLAYERSAKNPIFRRGSLLYGDILIVPMQNKLVRFNIGSTLKYCADYSTETETSHTVAVPTGYAVDRCLLIGAQALSVAYGGNTTGTGSFFWKEKEFDHDDKREVLIGMISGCQKNRFPIDFGGSQGTQWTDMGVAALDVAVKIA